MKNQTYTAAHADFCTPLTDRRDVLHLVEALLDMGVDRITVQTIDNKTVTIEPALHLSLDAFIKEMNGE